MKRLISSKLCSSTLPMYIDREQIVGHYTIPAILVIERISMSIPADNFAKLALLPSAV